MSPSQPHFHRVVDLKRPLRESQHNVHDLCTELTQVVQSRENSLSTEQLSVLQDYRSRKGIFRGFTNSRYPDDDKAYLYAHLFNVLIFQGQLMGRLCFEFDSNLNPELSGNTTVDHGYATTTIWSQDHIENDEVRVMEYVKIVLWHMTQAFMLIYSCSECWRKEPNWQEESAYGCSPIDMVLAIREAVTDPDYLGLDCSW